MTVDGAGRVQVISLMSRKKNMNDINRWLRIQSLLNKKQNKKKNFVLKNTKIKAT